MRLVCTLDNQKESYEISAFLRQQGIENQLEIVTNNDWGSEEYGKLECHVWVIDEDQFEKALEYVKEFMKNPQDPRYYEALAQTEKGIISKEEAPMQMKMSALVAKQKIGSVTQYILILCCLLLFASYMTEPVITKTPAVSIPLTPVFTSTINKKLMYDYPKTFEYINRIIKAYGVNALSDPEALPKEGKYFLNLSYTTPYWQGLYPMLVQHYKKPDSPWKFDAPLFEKIRQGEIWRVISPAFLHGGIFHLFFNMIWLVVLGKQMETRQGKLRYLVFIAIAALITNTAQYLMSGSNFIGFSGVLCAMMTFIWMRQKHAAWEGYRLEKGTMGFIVFFILFMFLIQIISFFIETASFAALPIGIANTAHLTGAALGVILARIDFFSWHAK